MCGIAGMMTIEGSAAPGNMLRLLTHALSHRGPDGHGTYTNKNVGLIQTRLAIIDLISGDQPFVDDQGVALVANGEIYNYVELRTGIDSTTLKTQSDCELPLPLYHRDGISYTKNLRGMYAIALHDPVTDKLFLSRDPFGIKPIYYADTPQGFIFASEPCALLATGLIKRQVRPRGCEELMQRHYTTGALTIYEGIYRVLPGETLVVKNGQIIERDRLSALPVLPKLKSHNNDPLIELDAVLEDSVRMHQRSDVPYGMFLSGGIDSSAVLAMMARCNDQPVKALTAGFSGTDVADERQHARKVADYFHADHIEVEFSENDFWTLLPRIAAAMDDPTTDYATLPTFKLAATAHAAGLKVILSGEGGDELFGGYGRYRRALRPWWLAGRMPNAQGTFDGLGVLRDNFPILDRDADILISKAHGLTRLQKVQALDCENWLPNDLLLKLDRCLMANGVEGRTPFLDPEMAKFAFNLPDNQKIRHGIGKYILRQWLARYAAIAEPFSKKRGFTVPVSEWINRKGQQIGQLVAKQESIRSFCHADMVAKLFTEKSHKRSGFAAWSLLFYALWHRHHRDECPSNGDIWSMLS
jgi:asparagine synthase (glutamine-hydrolysing)